MSGLAVSAKLLEKTRQSSSLPTRRFNMGKKKTTKFVNWVKEQQPEEAKALTREETIKALAKARSKKPVIGSSHR